MKILYLCAKHPPFDGRIHYKISQALLKNGFTLVNIHPNIDTMIDSGIKLIGFFQKPGFFGRIKSLKELYRFASIEQPDVVFAPEPDSLMVAYLLKRKTKKIKVIFDCHEWYIVHYTHIDILKNIFLAKILNKFITLAMHYIAKRINAIITVNDTMTNYFKKYNTRTYTIPSLMSENHNIDYNLPRNDFIYFGQFGGGGQEKILLDAARILKKNNSSAKILIIGGYHNDDEVKFNRFNEIINEDKLQDNIEIKKWLPNKEAFKLLNTGLAGIMRFDTGYYNGLPTLPNKIFEYMAFGMAVICCKINIELKKIVEEENCGIAIEKENGQDLANAIIYLHSNREKCLKMGKNSYTSTKIKYNWKSYGNILSEIINNC